MTADGLPPYRRTAPRGARVEVPEANALDTADNASDDAEPPSYDAVARRNRIDGNRGRNERSENETETERTDEKNRLIGLHNQQVQAHRPGCLPPDYFASSSSDCPHWVQRRCRLNARPRHCCTCMDKRPESQDGRYPVHMDGYAEPGSVVRWAHYCEACRHAESRLHSNFDTSARPPPKHGASAYRPTGSEQARAAKDLADAKALFLSGKGGDDTSWFGWETTGQPRERERHERKERKEQGRLRHEAARAKEKEAAERRLDEAWQSEQLRRLSRGEAVSSLTVRWHFLTLTGDAAAETDETSSSISSKKGKEKKEQKEKAVVGMARGYVSATYKERGKDKNQSSAAVQITAAEVRQARKAWEAGIEREEREREEREREQEEREHRERMDERRWRDQCDHKAKTPAPKSAPKPARPNEYEAYGDGAEVHRSVSRTISRTINKEKEAASERARAASLAGSSNDNSKTKTTGICAWCSRLFRRWGSRP